MSTQTHNLGYDWFAIHTDAGMKHETMVLSNAKTNETIALGSESCQKLREIFERVSNKK